MKKLSVSIFILVFTFSSLLCQEKAQPCNYAQGKVMESISMPSKILGKDVKYSIYLPPDYFTSSRSYPVVYLLHGYTDDETGWIQFGEANLIADKAIAGQSIPPMIIVMPDAGVSWYVNDYLGKARYEDMFFQEFIPFIDKTYHTRAKKEFRAVAGLSMGGYGALIYSLHHPDMFESCVAFSAAVRTDEEMMALTEEEYRGRFSFIYGPAGKPQERLTPHWRKNSVLNLVKAIPESNKKDVRYYIDCGDDDFLFLGNSMLHILMRQLNIPHEYRTRDGEHSWIYWRTGLPDGLKFIGEGFRR